MTEPAAYPISLNLSDRLRDRKFRQEYFLAETSRRIAKQLIELRERRDFTQTQLAQEIGTKQPGISRIEKADYQNWSFNTLRKIAQVLDARIRVIIQPSEDVLSEYDEAEGHEAPKATSRVSGALGVLAWLNQPPLPASLPDVWGQFANMGFSGLGGIGNTEGALSLAAKLLDERDRFIVGQGLWSEFVAHLAMASPEARKMADAPSGEQLRAILSAEGLGDWNIRIASDAYCWINTKTIQLPIDASLSLFLHEVAHALHPEPEGEAKNHYHGGGWASRYGELIDKYMVSATTLRSARLEGRRPPLPRA